MNKIILVSGILSIILVSVIVLSNVNFEVQKEDNKAQVTNLENEIITIPPKYVFNQTNSEFNNIKKDFTINIKGGMKHGDTIIINGTVPNPNTSITGMIIHNQDQIDVTLVHFFQLVSNFDGFYTHDVRINDDYLWKKEGQYTVSIQNGDKHKEIQFYRNG